MTSGGPVMAISYDVALDDEITFTVFQHSDSPLLKRRRRLLRVGMSALLAIIAASVAGLARAPVLGLIGLGFAFAFWWMFPRRYERGLRDSVAKIYGEGKNLDVLGPTRLELDDEFLTEATPTRSVRTRWAAIERCVETADHVFVYVTGNSAVIVPKRALSPEVAEKLVAEIRARMPARAS